MAKVPLTLLFFIYFLLPGRILLVACKNANNKNQSSVSCPAIAPACPLENCLKAGKHLEERYPGCDYSSMCEKQCQEETKLLKNISFEETVPDQGDQGKTLDPDVWQVAEGKAEKGTANILEEKPELIQVVSKENGVLPYDGEKMLKIDARFYLKTNIRQYYPEPITNGKLIQEIAVYPYSDEYLQQIEIRGERDKERRGYKTGNEEGIRGNQLFSLKYSHEGMLLVVTAGQEWKEGRHIVWKELPPLPKKQWSKIKIVLEKVEPGRDEQGEFSQFKLSLWINDKLYYESGLTSDQPHIQYFQSADFIVIGDDYVTPDGKPPQKEMKPTSGDSYGIVYYDLANAWR